jgi:hypothetical protein
MRKAIVRLQIWLKKPSSPPGAPVVVLPLVDWPVLPLEDWPVLPFDDWPVLPDD